MTLTANSYASRAAAYDAGEADGFDRDDLIISHDRVTGRYQWDLRSYGETVAVTGGEAPAEYDTAEDAISGAVCDVVAGLADVDEGDVDAPVLTDLDVSRGFASVQGGVSTVAAHVSAEVADAFGMRSLVASGLVVVQPEIAAPVAPAASVTDYVIRVPGRFDEASAREMALFYAGRLGVPLELVNAASGAVLASVMPSSARGASVARVPTVARGDGGLGRAIAEMTQRVTAAKAPRDWSTYSDAEIPESNASCRKTRNAIQEASEALDLDRLLAFGFAGSADDGTGNTYTRYNGNYLRNRIEYVRAALAEAAVRRAAEQAALDAEFGYTAVAA